MISDKLLYAYSLERFLVAQENCYEEILEQLKDGLKLTHWIWFIFPQLRGLGQSEYSQYFGLSSGQEAKEYWHHPVLGPRYRECLQLLLASGLTAESVLGKLDAKKLHSSLTLFEYAVPDDPLITSALSHLFDGTRDSATHYLIVKPIT